jgi:anti-sigma factor RsiW
MNMSCEQVSAQMIDLLYGELPAGERPRVEAHLADCERCRATLEGFRQVRGTVRAALEQPAPSRVHDVILRAARESLTARRVSFWDRLRGRWTMPALATVGALAVFALAGRLFLNPERTLERGRSLLAPATPAPERSPTPTPTPTPSSPAPSAAPSSTSAPAPSLPPAAVDGLFGNGAPAGKEATGPAARQRRVDRSGGRSLGLSSVGIGGEERGGSAAASRGDDLGVEKKLRKGGSGQSSFAAPPPPRAAAPGVPLAGRPGSLGGLVAEPMMDRAELSTGGAAKSKSRGAARAAREQEDELDQPALERRFDDRDLAPAPATNAAAHTGRAASSAPAGTSAPAAISAPASPTAAASPIERSRVAADNERSSRPSKKSAPPTAALELPAEAAKAEAPNDKPVAARVETLAERADRLFAERRWIEAAAAYRDLLRQNPRAAGAVRWRQRVAAAEAEQAAAAPPSPTRP